MFLEVTLNLFKGFLTSVELFCITLLIALPLGLFISLGSMSKLKPVKYLVRTIVWVVRGTPLLLQLAIFIYAPSFLFDMRVSDTFVLVAIAFGFNYACYFSEIYRGGIESVSIGQYEAGKVLGLTKSQTFYQVVLPQVVKRITPPMGNEFITLVKDTALANIYNVFEIMYRVRNYQSLAILWPFFYAGVFYLIFSGMLSLLFSYLEKRLSYYR